MSVSVQIKNVRLSPHHQAIDFALDGNQNWALIGNQNSGKNTLAKIIAGHILANGEYKVIFDKKSSLLPKTTFVSERHQYKNLNNLNDFYYQQRYNSLENEDAETLWQHLEKHQSNSQKIEQILNEFQLWDRKNAPVLQLSSGEHKRLQLAKVFVNPPQLLILDQPLVGLDSSFRTHFDQLLTQYSQKGVRMIALCAAQEIPSCISHVAVMQDCAIKKTLAVQDFDVKKLQSDVHKTITLPQTPALQQACNEVIRMDNICVKYAGKTIIEGLNWVVKPNEKWLITGKNGVGKSTLLSLITGDNPQVYSNQVYLFDQRRGRGESIWDVKKNIGYLSPELHAHFDKKLTVYQAIASGYFDTMGLYKTLHTEQKAHVHRWIELFDLKKDENQPLHYLDYTTQRWVLLARALVKNPPLLVFDEPCQGFSSTQKKTFIDIIDQLCDEVQKTIIYVSHYEDETPQHIEKKLIFKDHLLYQIL